ncbi:MAG: prepilin-type N-terminal cleavage/methylation domain-containing protein [Candidatus Eremiobacteraeota bacterium]|nr:prepilin-type N-terminal cleavage/methylation domain-containing protein [Candidatus Eremiobacteraeota bacterium]
MNLSRRRRICRKGGFTLVELMTVIFIMALLMVTAIPVYRKGIDRTHLSVCQANLRNITTALQAYQYEKKEFPTTLSDLPSGSYIKIIPSCPFTHTDTYSAGYIVDNDCGEFTICCKGTNHASLGFKADEPYYVFSRGLGP